MSDQSQAQPVDVLAFDNQVCFPLYSAANAVVRAYREPLARLDLTYVQYMVMLILWERGETSFKHVADRTRLDSGTLTPVLKRLEGKGLITRRRDDRDERVRLLALTPAGRELRAQAEAVPFEVACHLGLAPEKMIALKAMCEELLDAMTTD